MQTENKYIGDDKFNNLLAHYNCPTPLGVVKMRFAGAICSPNLELRPTDVISSLWPDGQTPRLATKEEADLFFKFFMGLWDETFNLIKTNRIKLPAVKLNSENLCKMADRRYEEIEWGFLEGFWGGCEDLKLPAFLAEVVDSLTDLAGIYKTLTKKLDNGANFEDINSTFAHTDRTVEKAISFIIENSVLPRIESLKRTVN